MKKRLTCLVLACFTLIALTPDLSAQHSPTQHPPVDLGAFTKEIMIMDFSDGQDSLAMWLPYEFFVAATLNEGQKTRPEVERDLEFLKPYITMVVQSSFDQPDGTSVYATEKEIRSRAVLKLADGSEALPLDKVPPMVSAIMAAMKAVLGSEGGEGKANLHIVVFSGLTKTGEKIVDTSQKAKLTLLVKANGKLKEKSFTWRTPFDAIASASECPRCKAGVSAKWTYCPFCGQKLPHD
jgi:hypothetical protein